MSAFACVETPRMVTVTIHVQSHNVCCGCCSPNNCTGRERFFKYRPKRFSFVIDARLVSACFSPTPLHQTRTQLCSSCACTYVPMLLPRPACRCNRQTVSDGSFASDGGSKCNARNTSRNKCALFTSVKLTFEGRLFRDTLLVMTPEIRNLTASRSGVGYEEVRALLPCVVAFLHLLRHQPAKNVWRSFVSFVCVNPPRLDHFVRTTLTN